MTSWTGLVSLVLGASWLIAPSASAIDDLQWLHPDSDRLAALTRQPAECVAEPQGDDEAYLLALGRVAFRSPFLLGGLAARSSMRCHTCHLNGHGNPDFFVEGFSREPGTADATSHLFSHSRGDGTFNPVAIPTLVDAGKKTTFGTMAPTDNLEAFVTSVIVDEFQGREPGSVILTGLLAYLRALRSDACPDNETDAKTFEADIKEIWSVYGVVLESLERQNFEAADFALVSLGGALGQVRRQFPVSTKAPELLVNSALALQKIRPLLRQEPESPRAALAGWRAQLDAVLPVIEKETSSSYYNPDVLAERLTR